MKKLIQKLNIIFLLFSCDAVLAMDTPSVLGPKGRLSYSPASPRKKIDRDCVKTFQFFNPDRARQFGVSLPDIMPRDFIITPDEKGIVAALGDGQVIFRKIVRPDSGVELVADGAGAKGAALITTGQRKESEEIIIALAVNHKKVFFYDGVEMKKFIARFEVWSRKTARDKDTVFIQEKMKRLEHRIQDIGINAQGSHTIATIEFPKPFLQQNRSALVIYDVKTNQTNAAWSHEGAWWSHLVIHDDGNLVACSDINGAIWIFEIKKGDIGTTLTPPIIIQTHDTILQLNYPSKIMMWYVTNDNQLKRLDVRKYLGVMEAARCITPISFEGIFTTHRVFAMEKCSNLSVVYWSPDLHGDAHNSVFFTREKDIFGQKDNLQKMTCAMGYMSNFSYENQSGQRVMNEERILHATVRGHLLAAMTSNGKIRIFKLTEGCGLIIPRSQSEGTIISKHSASKVIKGTKKEDDSDIKEKAISTDTIFKADLPELTKPRIKSFPPQKRSAKTIGVEHIGTCESGEKKRLRKFSVNEHPQSKSIGQKGQSPEFQRALQHNIFSDFAVKDPFRKDEESQKNS